MPGGVAILAINDSCTQAATLELPVAAERYTLSAPSLAATSVRLNRQELMLGRDDALPALRGARNYSSHSIGSNDSSQTPAR